VLKYTFYLEKMRKSRKKWRFKKLHKS